METRRTNSFLRVALGTRSPARQKLFKGKYHDMVANETKLPFNTTGIAGSDIKPRTEQAKRAEYLSRARGEHSEPRASSTRGNRESPPRENFGRKHF